MPLDAAFGALRDGHATSTGASTGGAGVGLCGAVPVPGHLDLSAGLEFGTPLAFEPDMVAALERALSRPGDTPRPVVLGLDADPYQPVERTLRLTRAVLEVLERFGHPVTIITRSAGVLGDLEPLRRMASRGLVQVWFAVATLDAALARGLEPRAAAPARRWHATAALAAAGVPVGVLAAPMIPGLNDAEMERILETAARAGARRAGYALLRPPPEAQDGIAAWLRQHFPERARHVLALVREHRAAALAEERRTRHAFSGPVAYPDALAQRFVRATRRLGLQAHTDPAHTASDAAGAAPPVARADAQPCRA